MNLHGKQKYIQIEKTIPLYFKMLYPDMSFIFFSDHTLQNTSLRNNII